jgi:hypothetical protein
MAEWIIPFEDSLASDLNEDLRQGPIIDDNGIRYLTEQTVDRFNGFKIEIFSKEHPPPHFRVCYAGECGNYTILNCTQINGGLRQYYRNIRKWHMKNKGNLIKAWNDKRPSDCPVGKIQV